MKKSFSLFRLLIGVSLLMLVFSVALRYHREREFLNWYNGEELVIGMVTKGDNPRAFQKMDEIINEFRNGCERYQCDYYREFSYNDCKAELERLSAVDAQAALTDHQKGRLTRRLVAMMRLNGMRGHQLVYQFSLDVRATWLSIVWQTYDTFFGVDSLETLVMATKRHEAECLFYYSEDSTGPQWYPKWRIGTYFQMHDTELAEMRAAMFVHTWCRNSENRTLALERHQAGLHFINSLRSERSPVQERTMSKPDLDK